MDLAPALEGLLEGSIESRGLDSISLMASSFSPVQLEWVRHCQCSAQGGKPGERPKSLPGHDLKAYLARLIGLGVKAR